MKIERNPETSAALQMLYWAADHANVEGRMLTFRAIARLNGQPIARIERTWKATR